MKQIITTALLFVILSGFAQENQRTRQTADNIFSQTDELHFQFRVPDASLIKKLSSVISIDDVDGDTVFAYANEQEFLKFLNFSLPWETVKEPPLREEDIRMAEHIDIDQVTDWDFYPTYEAYIDMMNQFQTDYPGLCQVFSIGKTVNNRDLMMAKISANVGVREAEPQFLYTGTMHGDELVGYNLLLRLIDYLLSNYGTDPKVTDLLNNMEIWINPLANPDGTYYGGNSTVWNSRRYNGNSIDLNRNYPDPEEGPHPDGHAWQPETLAFMQLAEENDFVMSANTHSGAEVINYPWDTWPRRAADDDWWISVCRAYADTVHLYSPSTYMDYLNNGITNGWDWYTISGGRQDYMNYFMHCREVTMELSNTKKLPVSQLENHWQWNFRSLLNYMEACTFGVTGTVSDVNTGQPLPAKVYIDGHDEDNSFVFADSIHGFYQRLLFPGSYDITFSCNGYQPVTIQNVTVTQFAATTLNVQLGTGELSADFSAGDTEISPGTAVNFSDNSTGTPTAWHWHFEGAVPAEAFVQNPINIVFSDYGDFDVSLTVFNASGDSSTLTKTDYIHVRHQYLMQNGTITVCQGLFYDSGGKNGNYQNNEDYILTFTPEVAGAKIRADFQEFDIEAQTTCNYDRLEIYDGSSTAATLIGTYCGSNSPGAVKASNAAGSLTFLFHSDYSETRPGWKAGISCTMEQTLVIPAGWSGISSVVLPDNPELETLFQDILNRLIILQNQNGFFYPAQNINTLKSWMPDQGYQIKLQSESSVTFSGTVDGNKEIEIVEGWNELPVLSPCSVFIEELLENSTANVLFIGEMAGTAMFWPAAGINTLQELQPGKAYFLKAENEGRITFPVCQ